MGLGSMYSKNQLCQNTKNAKQTPKTQKQDIQIFRESWWSAFHEPFFEDFQTGVIVGGFVWCCFIFFLVLFFGVGFMCFFLYWVFGVGTCGFFSEMIFYV